MAKNILIYIALISLSLISVLTLFHSGLIPTHDGEYHVIRFYEFNKVLTSGVLYPRIAPDLNDTYTVPLFNFVYPLPNYVASFFHVFGLSFIDSFKANMIVATIIGAIGMYLWSKTYWGKFGGLISSVVYSFAPYRLLDIFIRGSVGEVWALALFPYLLYFSTQLFLTKKKIYIPGIGISLGLLIFSHNILALLFFCFYLTYILLLLLKNREKQLFISTIVGGCLGISLASVFWLPALLEKQYVRGLEIFSVDRHFVEIYQLLIPSWGSGFSGDSLGSGLSFQIGVVNILVLFFVIFFFVKNKKFPQKRVVAFCLLWLLIACFLMLSFSKVIWTSIPLMNFFQFPWRLLSLVILLLGFLSGVIGQFKHKVFVGLAVIIATIFLTYSYTVPAYYHQRDDAYYIAQDNFIHGTNSSGDVFNTLWFEQQKSSSEAKLVPAGEVSLSNIIIQPQRYSFNYQASQGGEVHVNTAYFPGWIAISENGELPLYKTSTGIMKIDLKKGEGRVDVLFADTMVRQIAAWITFLSFLLILFLLIRYGFKSRNR